MRKVADYLSLFFHVSKKNSLNKLLLLYLNLKLYEPGHEKMCLMSYANNKGADQHMHWCSLSSTFVVRCLDSIISLDSIAELSISRL